MVNMLKGEATIIFGIETPKVRSKSALYFVLGTPILLQYWIINSGLLDEKPCQTQGK